MEPGFGRPSPEELLLPEVIAQRCVHSRMEQARCRACVDACPTNAWVIDDERVGIDADRCDGCGLCSPACPEGAVVERFEAVRFCVDGTAIAFAACSQAGIGGTGEGVIPCLHLIGVRALLALYRQGVRRLLLSRGDCDACPRGGVIRIEHHHEQAAALLADRELAPMPIDDLPPGRWQRSLNAARDRHRAPALGRRALFRGVLIAAAERAQRAEPGTPDFVPPGRLLPGTGRGRLSLHAPRIDPDLCNGCDACGRLCPHEVIRVEEQAYRLEPDGCTGCGICVDVCNQGAVAIRALDPEPQNLVNLYQHRCGACGVRFHSPRSATDQDDLCPICSASNHHKKLYQVLA